MSTLASASRQALLSVELRRKAYAGRAVLQDIHLELAAGELVALVGSSGCGKSTLLRVVAGLEGDFDGEVRLAGEALSGPVRDIRFVFQEPRLFPWLTVAQNVAFDWGDLRRSDSDGHQRQRVEALLTEVGLQGLGDRLPKQLSGGQAQRAAIARGLFVQPRVLLLDEPFSAVDAFTRLKLQDLLLGLVRKHGISVLIVTHDIDEAVRLADRVLVLEADPGRVVADVPVSLAHPREPEAPATRSTVAVVRHALHAVHAI